MRKFFFLLAGLGLAGFVGYRLVVRPWWRSWGVEPGAEAQELPGDGVVPDADGVETRAIRIEAPPSAVWPWLVQMGYGRAGWYSYDAIDMEGASADRIVPEWQAIEVGQVMPTHPGGGFVVESLEPNRSLVLYLDHELVRRQAEEASGETPANLRAAGAFMEGAQPTEFAASWAFVLEPDGDGTRLIERTRVKFGPGDDRPWTRFTLPLMGFGVFVMMRRQLLGIKERAERRPTPQLVPA